MGSWTSRTISIRLICHGKTKTSKYSPSQSATPAMRPMFSMGAAIICRRAAQLINLYSVLTFNSKMVQMVATFTQADMLITAPCPTNLRLALRCPRGTSFTGMYATTTISMRTGHLSRRTSRCKTKWGWAEHKNFGLSIDKRTFFHRYTVLQAMDSKATLTTLISLCTRAT